MVPECLLDLPQLDSEATQLDLVVDAAEKERVLLAYFDVLRSDAKHEKHALGRMKRIARYFTAKLPNAGDLRYAVLHADTVDEAVARVKAFFADLDDDGSSGAERTQAMAS